jgi:hypothetical protein
MSLSTLVPLTQWKGNIVEKTALAVIAITAVRNPGTRVGTAGGHLRDVRRHGRRH